MNNFITLTNVCTGCNIMVNVNNIAYMEPDIKHNTIIYFLSPFEADAACPFGRVIVKETMKEIQKRIFQ